MLFFWIPGIALTIWFTVQVVEQYTSAVANPTSTIIRETKDRLSLPQVTICNWNQNGNSTDPSPLEYCPECDLSLVSCTYATVTDCHAQWTRHQYVTDSGEFSCWDFNSFPDQTIYSATTGYSGAYSTIWTFPLFNITDPPTTRSGAQVTFNAPGAVTPQMINSETRFAPVGYDSFFSMQLVLTIHAELAFFDPLYNVTTYNTPVTTVNLLSPGALPDFYPDGSTGYVGISFAYQTLSQQTVLYAVPYTIESLFGDLSAVIAAAMGVDLIKISCGVALFYVSWKHRTITPVANLFNS